MEDFKLHCKWQYLNISFQTIWRIFYFFETYCEAQAKLTLNPYTLSLCLELTLKLVDPPTTGSLLIPRIKLIVGQVR